MAVGSSTILTAFRGVSFHIRAILSDFQATSCTKSMTKSYAYRIEAHSLACAPLGEFEVCIC